MVAKQPPSKDTEDQNLNITGATQGTQTTEQARQTQQTNITQEFLAKLGFSAASTPVGSPVGQDRGVGVLNQQTEGPLGVGQQRTVGGVNQQQTKTEESESQTVVVDCRYCGGCCGGRRGRRLPRRVVGLVRRVKELLGLRYECEVLNMYPELFCVGSGRGHGLNRVKERERLLSREAQYKGSYLVKRLGECSSDNVCVHYVRLGVEGWLRLWFYLNNRALGEGVVESYLGRIAKSLGFSGVVELVRYLRLVVQGLVVEYPTDRHAGYKDILEVGCGLCGALFRTTDPLPAFIVNLVRHFQIYHGLRTAEDVKSKVGELMVRELDRKDRPKAHPALRELVTEKLINTFANILVAIGLLEETDSGRFRCVLDGVVVDGAPGVVAHVLDYHHDVIQDVRRMLEVRGGAHGGEGAG